MRMTQLEQEVSQKNVIIEKLNKDLAKKSSEIKENNLRNEQINV